MPPLAIDTTDAIIDAGHRIPEDIARIGCGNLRDDVFARVPLSSADQNSRAIGERTAAISPGAKMRPRT